METVVKKSYPVTGLSCASCAISVESILKAQKGVINATVNYANATAFVEYTPDIITAEQFKTAIQSIGYDLLIEEDETELQEEIQHSQYQTLKRNTLWATILALPVVVLGMFMMDFPYANYIMLALTTPVLFWFGRSFFVNAVNQAKHGQANMDTLVALSTGIAYLFSTFNTFLPGFWHSRGLHPQVYFEASSVVIAFILLGKVLEERAKSNTSSAIKKLMGLQPSTVYLINENGQEMEIAISQVKQGDRLLVKPGDKIPVDGQIIMGNSFIDESTITGESLPVEKQQGDTVFAGTINQKGSFQFLAQKIGGETVLAHIIKMVQQAQGSKPPVQKLVDKIAGIFVPVVMSISVLSFIIWMVFGGENALTHALLAMVTVLVIACPCALGLATPTAIMVGIGKGAGMGILIKDAESLELAHKVNAIILDKTGTITEGKPIVTDLYWNITYDQQKNVEQDEKNVTDLYWNITPSEQPDISTILYTIEMQSEHPLAEAVVAALKSTPVSPLTNDPAPKIVDLEKVKSTPVSPLILDQFESITGKGVKATYQGVSYLVGNLKLMKDYQVTLSVAEQTKIESWQAEAKTVICFAAGRKVAAIIAIADQIKSTSAKAIDDLQRKGIEVYMLTGDNLQTARAVADKVKLKNFKAEMLPADKADFIISLQQQGKIVAMVGDGINDSHALAQANVSIAMGKGADIAMDVAKMTIISSDLQLIAKAIKLSDLTVKTIHQNLFWAFIYNLIGIPIAAGILFPIWGFMLNPMIAGAAMAMSSVSVVSNSLRLKGKSI